MEVRPGYKRTEVGIIPEDWDVGTVGQQFSVQLGKMLDAKSNVGVVKPYLGNRAVQWDRIDIAGLSSVPLSPGDLLRFRLEKGDLLACEGGEVGRAAIWDAPLDECYYQKALHRLRPLKDFDPRFMVAILHRWADRGMLANYVTQTSIAHLPRNKFIEVPIPLPTVAEQHAIATALSDVDALLGGLDRLIAKKRDLKQAAMQQLLTGQTRLPGFHGEWEVKRLREIASIRNQKVLPSNVGIDTPCVELDHIEQGNGRLLECSTAQNSKSTKYRFFSGDVLFGRLRSYLRKFWHADRDGICTTEIWPLMTDSQQADSGFLHAIVQSDRFIEAANISFGTHMPRADWGVMRNFEVRLPQVREQLAIAEILADMDAELSALESRRDKTRDLKQGMVQELLTGRTRLI